MKRWTSVFLVLVFLVIFGAGPAFAGDVITNGSFEAGDYSGWVLAEGPPPDGGTWGIVQDGQTVDKSDVLYDYCDDILVRQNSAGLPLTLEATDSGYLAIQLQKVSQEHRMMQDVALPENASALSWDMLYDNQASSFASNQYLAVHVRDLEDNILETLFLTDDSQPLSVPMTNYSFDISAHAGKTVRIDVQMMVFAHFFSAAFDNFRVELEEEAIAVPPGWSKGKGKTLEWWEKHEARKIPLGFSKGKKKGWDK